MLHVWACASPNSIPAYSARPQEGQDPASPESPVLISAYVIGCDSQRDQQGSEANPAH